MENALTVRKTTELATMSLTDLTSPLQKSLREDEGHYKIHQMPTVTSSLKERAALILPRIESRLAPAMPLDVLAQVKRLLGFYYKDPKESAGEIAAAAELWIEILCEFPEWAVYGAIKEYLRNDKKGHKPKPGQIVELARQQVSKDRAMIGLCRALINAPIPAPEPVRTPPTEEQKAAVTKILREAGFKSSRSAEAE